MSEEILTGIYEQLGDIINEITHRPQVALNKAGATMLYVKQVLKHRGIEVGPVINDSKKFVCEGQCTDLCPHCGDIMECQFVCSNCGEQKSIECIIKDPAVEIILKLGLIGIIIGLALLLVSIIRERLWFYKKDRYKDVRR